MLYLFAAGEGADYLRRGGLPFLGFGWRALIVFEFSTRVIAVFGN